MKLFHRSFGTGGHPLIILHGLLGSSDNWYTQANAFGRHFRVFTLDARNHGRSPHSDDFSYNSMAEDVLQFMRSSKIGSAHFLGHSMGGKTAMHLALHHSGVVDRLVVVDIAPRAYEPRHDEILQALVSLDLSRFSHRRQVDEALSHRIDSPMVRQFLLKNLRRDATGAFRWKMNLAAIRRHYNEVNAPQDATMRFDRPALFVRGTKSDHVLDADRELIERMFPCSTIVDIDAGHWIHAEAPAEFQRVVLDFLGAS